MPLLILPVLRKFYWQNKQSDLFSDIDAVTATFQVFINTYFLNFTLALLWFCLLIVLRDLVHLI